MSQPPDLHDQTPPEQDATNKPDPLLGQLIKQLRIERKIRQERLAFSADITVSTLSRIERAVTGPYWVTVEKIAVALGLTLLELVEILHEALASLPLGAHLQLEDRSPAQDTDQPN